MMKWLKESWKTTKNVFLAYDFSYATDLKRAEGEDGDRGKRHWALWAIQPLGEKEFGWHWRCHQGRELHLQSANSNRHRYDKTRKPSAHKHRTAASHILLYISLQSCTWWEPQEQTPNRCLLEDEFISHPLPQQHVCYARSQKHWHPAQRALIQPIQLTLSLSHNISNEWDSQVTTYYHGISLWNSVSDRMQRARSAVRVAGNG